MKKSELGSSSQRLRLLTLLSMWRRDRALILLVNTKFTSILNACLNAADSSESLDQFPSLYHLNLKSESWFDVSGRLASRHRLAFSELC